MGQALPVARAQLPPRLMLFMMSAFVRASLALSICSIWGSVPAEALGALM
jgi:hypothetical protein